jgi:hypothetical protein
MQRRGRWHPEAGRDGPNGQRPSRATGREACWLELRPEANVLSYATFRGRFDYGSGPELLGRTLLSYGEDGVGLKF